MDAARRSGEGSPDRRRTPGSNRTAPRRSSVRHTRVFLACQNPVLRSALLRALRRSPEVEVCGQADTAAHTLAGVALLHAHVAIVELSLAGSSDFRLVRHLTRGRAAGVLVVGARRESQHVEAALQAGARGYLLTSDLSRWSGDAVRRARRGRIYVSPTLVTRLLERHVPVLPSQRPSPATLLSDREFEVFDRIGGGQSTRVIAIELRISAKTVHSCRSRIMRKLGLAGASELVREAIRWAERGRATGA